MKTLLAVAFTLFFPASAAAQSPPAEREACFARLAEHTWERGAEPKVNAGIEFMTALARCDELLAVAVNSQFEYRVHDKEAKIFAKQRDLVIAAYGVIWVILAIFLVAMFLRQRRLVVQIADLETKLRNDAAR